MGTKRKILDIALELFNERGTRAVSTNHIAAAAGISIGHLYHYFKNKEEIIRSIFSLISSDLGESSPEAPREKAGLAALRGEFERLLQHKWRYHFFYQELGSLIERDRQLKVMFHDFQQQRLKIIQDLFHSFSKAKIFVPMDKQTRISLSQAVWIIGIYWFSYSEADRKQITFQGVEESLKIIFFVLKPYLTDPSAVARQFSF